MDKGYKINNVFNEDGLTFNELISTFLVSFLDKQFNLYRKFGTINTDIISSL